MNKREKEREKTHFTDETSTQQQSTMSAANDDRVMTMMTATVTADLEQNQFVWLNVNAIQQEALCSRFFSHETHTKASARALSDLALFLHTQQHTKQQRKRAKSEMIAGKRMGECACVSAVGYVVDDLSLIQSLACARAHAWPSTVKWKHTLQKLTNEIEVKAATTISPNDFFLNTQNITSKRSTKSKICRLKLDKFVKKIVANAQLSFLFPLLLHLAFGLQNKSTQNAPFN